jgi:hypothetical protein
VGGGEGAKVGFMRYPGSFGGGVVVGVDIYSGSVGDVDIAGVQLTVGVVPESVSSFVVVSWQACFSEASVGVVDVGEVAEVLYIRRSGIATVRMFRGSSRT